MTGIERDAEKPTFLKSQLLGRRSWAVINNKNYYYNLPAVLCDTKQPLEIYSPPPAMASALCSPLVAQPRPSSLRAPRQLQRAKAAANPEGPSTRREALWALAAAASLLAPLPASAAADGSALRAVLRAPYEFYRSRQQQNDGAKILAPIRASRQKLQECLATLGGSPGSSTYAAALDSLRSASMNCYDFDVFAAGSFEATSSLLQQKLRFADVRIADPCTYRLIYKNATTLTQSAELVGAAGAQLDEVIRSFQLLDSYLDTAQQGDAEAQRAVPGLLQRCIDANTRFEGLVQRCIGLEA